MTRRSNELFGPLMYMLPKANQLINFRLKRRKHINVLVTPHKNRILHRTINVANHYETEKKCFYPTLTAQGAITAFIT